ncbi:hypothetical protein [Longispora albida]|uniref:hypothetical protein n=1 Tax=Longispora albida TaxID=203523 RepID=UPI00036260A4|nr:hypothetical protein [Longispora albida]
METGHEVLVALARRYAFGDIAALVNDAEVGRICEFGQGLLELDAEDFGSLEISERLKQRALEARMPQSPREQPRGALASLRPAYSLLLEVIAARWQRREMAALVAAIHIASEYLPLLIWEPVLGHAGDPARLTHFQHSRFGQLDDRECPHNRTEKSSAARALRVISEPPAGWRAYLDRQHSNVAHAVAVCAAECRVVCAVTERLTKEQHEMLARRSAAALKFGDSAVVRLRHAAPVGHGFGVPSPEEVLEAWARTRESLSLSANGNGAGKAIMTEDGFPLPGLPSLFTALAGVPIEPATLLRDVAAELADCLTLLVGDGK